MSLSLLLAVSQFSTRIDWCWDWTAQWMLDWPEVIFEHSSQDPVHKNYELSLYDVVSIFCIPWPRYSPGTTYFFRFVWYCFCVVEKNWLIQLRSAMNRQSISNVVSYFLDVDCGKRVSFFWQSCFFQNGVKNTLRLSRYRKQKYLLMWRNTWKLTMPG